MELTQKRAPRRAPPLLGFRQALLAKELPEWRRTKRLWVALGVQMVAVVLLVLLAYLLADAPLRGGRRLVGASFRESWVGGWAALNSSVSLAVVVAATMGALSREWAEGTAAWAFTKPLSRSAFLGAKLVSYAFWTAMLLVVPGVLVVGSALLLFDGFRLHDLLLAMLPQLLHAWLFMACTLAVSAWFASQAVVGFVGFGLLLGSFVASPFLFAWSRAVGQAMPVNLAGIAASRAIGRTAVHWSPVAVSLVIIVVALVLAQVGVARRRF